MSLQLVSIN